VSSDYVVSGTHPVDGTVISVIIDANLNNLLDIDEPPATGPVVVSGGSWATAPISISGNTRFLVVANDPISGLPSSLVVHNVSYSMADTTPPSLSGVAFEPSVVNVANQSAVSFSLQGAETGTTASYRITSSGGETELEGGPVSVTEANQSITGVNVSSLSDGTLTLSLTLTDAADNTSNPATTTTIQKDTTAPAVTAIAVTNGQYNAGDSISFNLTLNEAVTVTGSSSTLTIVLGEVLKRASFVNASGSSLTYRYTVQAGDNTSGSGVVVAGSGLSQNGASIKDSAGNDADLTFTYFSNSNAVVDTRAPSGYSASITPATIDKSNEAAVGIQLSNAEVGATYSYSISSSGGGTAVTGSGTVSTASALIGGINATALAEGTLTLTVTLTDSAGNSGDAKTATATKSYAAAPVITQGEAIAVSMSEDGAPNAFSLTLNATDANSSDTLSWSIKTAAAHGEASVSGAGNSKAISYTPDADFSGSDSFEVQVSDGALTDSIVVNATVELVNDAPVLTAISGWQPVGTPGISIGVVAYTSLVLAADGTPYLAYADNANSNKVTVMKFNAAENKWLSLGGPAISAGTANYINLALAADGTPYLSYQDGANGYKATLMKFNTADNTWLSLGDPGISAGRADYTSLALASDGTPYLAYQDFANGGKATVMKFDAAKNEWLSLGDPGISAGEVYYTSLALASDGTPYLAYQDAANRGKATVMKFNAAENEWSSVGSPGFSVSGAIYTNLALTADGTPYLAYQDVANDKKATVMKFNAAENTWQSVGSPGISADFAYSINLVLAADGTPYLAYQDAAIGGKATVMKFNAAENKWLSVGSSAVSTASASEISMALTADGKPYLAYRDAGNGHKATVLAYLQSALGGSLNLTEDSGANLLLRGITISDTDSNTITLTLALSDIKAGILSGTAAGTATLSYDSETGVLTLTGPLADVNTSLASIVFTPTANYSGSFSFTLDVSDGNASLSTVTTSVVVNALNDKPVVTGTPEAVEMNSSEVKAVSLVGLVSDEEDSFGRGLTLTAHDWLYGTITEKDGVLTLKANADANGQQRVNLTLTDSGKASVQIELDIEVNLVQPPLVLSGSCRTDVKVYLGTPFELDLNNCFKGPVGQPLSMTVITTKPAAVQAAIDSATNKLTLTGIKAGQTATVTITASNAAATQDLTLTVQVVDAVAPLMSPLERVELNTTGAQTAVTELQLLEKVEGNSLLEKKQNLVQSGTGIPEISKINGHARGSAEWHKHVSASGDLLLGSGNHIVTWQLTDVAGGKSTEVRQELWLWPQMSVSIDKSEVVYPGGFTITYSLSGNMPQEFYDSYPFDNNIRLLMGTNFLSGSCIDYGYYVISTDGEAYDKGRTYSPPILLRGSDFAPKPTTDISCNASLTVFGRPAYRNRHPDPESSAVTVTIKPEVKANQTISAIIVLKSSLALSGVTSFELDVVDDFATVTGVLQSRVSITSVTPGSVASSTLSVSAPAGQVGLTDMVNYPVTLIKTNQGYQVQLPDGLEPGVYQLALEYSNEYGQKGSSNLVLSVVESLPELDPNKDTDDDGLLDTEEGLRDSNGNGIADYLDLNTLASQLQLSLQDNAALQCQAGRLCALGAYALAAGADGAALTQTEWQLVSNVGPDEDYQPVSDIFDFVIRQLPSVGSSTAVVLPLSQPVPAGAVYRKFANGQWSSFVEDELNQLHSAPSDAAGACPSPRSPAYRPGLNAGDYCVQLTLQDGGPNDADGIANGEIFDPGVLALQGNQLPEPQADVLTLKLNSSGEINLLANDTDPDGDTLELTNVRGFSGTLEFSADGLVQLTPPEDFVGTLSFSYQVADSEGALAESTLEVNVSPNSLPVGTADTASTTNKVAITIDVLANDTDADGDNLTLVSATAQQGYVQVQNNKLRYVPKAGFVGTDTVSYRVVDEWQGVTEGNLTVTVEAHPQQSSDDKSGGAGIGVLIFGLLSAAAWRRRSYQRGVTLR
jgi:hypothetical protein